MNITEILVPAQEIAWLPWAVQYFFYIGSAYGAAILFLVAIIFHKQTSHHLRAALALTMLIGVIVGPLALTGDLHQPGRAWHFFVHLTPWSWMSLGSLLLPLFSMLATLTAWLYLRGDLSALHASPYGLIRKLRFLTLGSWQISHRQLVIVASLTAISGLSIALYTSMEIAILASRPLWHQPAAPLLWFTTAFLATVGFTLLIWLLFPTQTRQPLLLGDSRVLRRTIVISSILALTLIPIWAANNTTFSLYQDVHWITHLALMAISIMLCIIASRTILAEQLSRIAAAIVAITTLIAAWSVRWVTMMEVQTIPRFDVGPYPYELPLGSAGLLGIVGMFGIWIAIALAASEVVQPIKKQQPIASIYLHQQAA